jgi:hypothetical protein
MAYLTVYGSAPIIVNRLLVSSKEQNYLISKKKTFHVSDL